MFGLVHTAVVSLPNFIDGDYTLVDNAALPCRLTLVPPEDGKDAHERAELAAMRRLLWGPDYTMPENARVNVNGYDWLVVAGSFAAVGGVSGAIVYNRCELTRAL
jgi:hypothetical protein